MLQNARLFDGEIIYPGLMDIFYQRGIIKAVRKASKEVPRGAVAHDVQGRFVTPGLVDMHSHHLAITWPATDESSDDAEVHDSTGAVTPQMRILDALKPYDNATKLICSGGVTSSLVIPGSSNIVGGEGVAVKNVLYSGQHGEPVVEELLLERGINVDERQRYMKMAFGENPKRLWGHSRLGTAWHLRQHMQKAKDLKDKQDDYCAALQDKETSRSDGEKHMFVKEHGRFPFDLQLESTVALLRGKVALHNHNYEPQDMQAMLRISKEFGYKVKAFHHATSAWQVPELLKHEAENITIAIFAEFSLYKSEAYNPSLSAGQILDSHGINVAYKSDHSTRELNAKYLASQAAVAHSFHLPELKALRSITSIPANAMDQGHRIGYCRPGYDADMVVWDAHPLEVGATPLQVFVDGMPQLDDEKVKESTGSKYTDKVEAKTQTPSEPVMRAEIDDESKNACAKRDGSLNMIVTGIKKNFVHHHAALKTTKDHEEMQLVVNSGRIVCLGGEVECADARITVQGAEHSVIALENGHLSRGLTAVTSSLGMHEIGTNSETGDGDASSQKLGDPDTVVYAKHGVHLDGKEFVRARLGGVTRAVTGLVATGGDVQGVSAEILTSGKKSLLHGGVVQEDVAFRVSLGKQSMLAEGSVSRGVQMLRNMLRDGQGKHNETVYGKVSRGELPLVVTCQNRYDIEQLILIKKDFPATNLVILGGQEASFVSAFATMVLNRTNVKIARSRKTWLKPRSPSCSLRAEPRLIRCETRTLCRDLHCREALLVICMKLASS